MYPQDAFKNHGLKASALIIDLTLLIFFLVVMRPLERVIGLLKWLSRMEGRRFLVRCYCMAPAGLATVVVPDYSFSVVAVDNSVVVLAVLLAAGSFAVVLVRLSQSY